MNIPNKNSELIGFRISIFSLFYRRLYVRNSNRQRPRFTRKTQPSQVSLMSQEQSAPGEYEGKLLGACLH